MKILLVWPHIRKKLNLAFLTYQNHTLQQIAGLTPKNHSVKILDERYEYLNFNEKCDLVGVSSLTYFSKRSYEIADTFRSKGIPVVIGGYHASALPEEAKQHADAVVIGEAEKVWPKLLEDLENNSLKPFYKNTTPVEPEFITPANRDAGGNLPRVAGIEASRGCPVGCEFCAVSNIVGGKIFRAREVDVVIDEIKSIKNKWLYFFSPSMTANPEYSKSLFKEMKGLGKKFSCYGNVNVLERDEEYLRLASEAGAKYWIVGLESISQEAIKEMGKKTNKVTNYHNAVKQLHKYKMKMLGNFMYGFDTDTPDIFKRTVKMAKEIKVDLAQFSILTPFPGTPLFERFKREDRIVVKNNWRRFNETDVVFKHPTMTSDQIIKGAQKSYEQFYDYRHMFELIFGLKNYFPSDLINLWKLKNLDYKVYYKGKGLQKKDLKKEV